MPLLSALACCAALLAPASAFEGRWSAAVSPGVAIPVGQGLEGGGYELVNDSSFHMQAAAGYEFVEGPHGVWLGLEAGFSPGHAFAGRIVSTDFDGDGTRDSLAFASDTERESFHAVPTVRARGTLEMAGDQVTYYFSVGGGAYSFWGRAGLGTLSGRGSSGADLSGRTFPIAASSNSFFGLTLGHGLGYEVTDLFEIGLDLRYHMVFKPHDPAQLVVPSVRLGFHF